MAQVICGCGRTHKVLMANGKTEEVPNTVYVPSGDLKVIKANGKEIRPTVAVQCGQCSRDERKMARESEGPRSSPVQKNPSRKHRLAQRREMARIAAAQAASEAQSKTVAA